MDVVRLRITLLGCPANLVNVTWGRLGSISWTQDEVDQSTAGCQPLTDIKPLDIRHTNSSPNLIPAPVWTHERVRDGHRSGQW